jgi:hypothetical protein
MYPLKTETIITLDECKKLSESILHKSKPIKKNILLHILIVVAFIVFGQYLAAIMFSLWALIVYYFIKRNMQKQTEKNYQSNKNIQNQKVQYEFYEEFFQTKTLNSESKMSYSNLYDIIETKEHFYLMESNAVAYIIIKNNCSIELTNHIQELIKKRRNGK